MNKNKTTIQFNRSDKYLYELATFHKENGEYDKSLKYLNDLMKKGTKDPQVYAFAGSCYFDLGLNVLSLNCWFKYLSLTKDCDHARAYNAIGACYHTMDERHIANKYFEKQMEKSLDEEFEYDELLMENCDMLLDDIKPNFFICYPENKIPASEKIKQAENLAHEEKFIEAVQILDTVDKNSKLYSKAMVLKACFYYYADKKDEAVQILECGLKELPNDKNVLVNFIGLMTALNRQNELKNCFSLLENTAFDSAEDYFKVAITCLEAKREDIAIKFLLRSIEIDKYFINAYLLLGIAKYNKKEFENSQKYFKFYYDITGSFVAKYYLKLAYNTGIGVENFKKLEYTNNLPKNVKNNYLKMVKSVIRGGQKAYDKVNKTQFFEVLDWVYSFDNDLQNDALFELFSIFTPKIRNFYFDLMLDVAIQDQLKTKILTMLGYWGYDKKIKFVFNGNYKTLKISKLEIDGKNAPIFHFSYSNVIGKLVVMFENNTADIKDVCETIYAKLDAFGDVNLIQDERALSAVIAILSPIKFVSDDIPITFFDADKQTVDYYLRMINNL